MKRWSLFPILSLILIACSSGPTQEQIEATAGARLTAVASPPVTIVSLPTAIPQPSDTPEPTNTPRPADTPKPANTSKPAAPTDTPFSSLVDTTVADFGAGAPDTNTYLAQTNDGEVMLAPTVGVGFSGTALPAGWFGTPWATGGGATVGGGVVTVDGALIGTNAYYGPGHSLEFVATFGANTGQHVGFGTNLNAAPWAIFSTGDPGGPTLRARTNSSRGSLDTDLGGTYLGTPHRYRIAWTSTGIVYSIDGVQVASHAIAITANMRPVGSDQIGGLTLAIDWMRMSPSGVFVSRLHDAGAGVHWLDLASLGSQPAGTSLAYETRTGDTTKPDDGTWSAWTSVAGTAIGSPDSRYLQYRVTLRSMDLTTSSVVQQVTITYQLSTGPTSTSTPTAAAFK